MAGMLPDYPAPPGNKKWADITIAGPTSYTQISTGTPPTGGQTIQATDIGLVDIDWAVASLSDNGQYEAIVCYPSNPQTAVTSIKLMWKTASTGAQVTGATNLSGRTIRLIAYGN